MRNHARVSRQYRLDTVFAHPFQDFLLQGFLLRVPTVGIRPAPSFEVIHRPPGKERRTGNEAVGFFFCVAQFGKHVAPYTFLSHGGKRKVDAMQCHPVDFLFPACPVPESHGIRVGAIVEVVAQAQVGFMSFGLGDGWERSGQFCRHVVPRKVDAGIVFQVPVQTGSNVYVGVSAYHNFVSFLVQFEEVGICVLLELNDEFFRCSRFDSFQ